ncbi:MAG TPA: sugar phosphate isomerase/epimerase family protein [Bacteroidales bacterium]|jgi:hexulose-6-phosphate isomerase|nr:sugar phosphate isomerase/epimerase family protein [Bacteroidales bacterium]
MNRRDFTRNTIMASAVAAAAPSELFSSFAERPLKKGIMWGSIGTGKTILEKFRAAKAAGFDGVEVMSHMNRDEVLQAHAETGLPIPSVCGEHHWKFLLSDPDPEVRAKGVEALKVSIEDANAYGADTVLLVPGRVTENVSYDECWSRSVDEIKKVLQLAKDLKVKIAIENVWNNFLLSPMEAATYVDQFKTVFVGFYFDCGNIVNFGWPEQWIKILNRRIAKVHIKEFSRKLADTQGKGAGFKVNLLEGDVSWSKVMSALDKIGYQGWTTIEQPGGDTPEGLKDLCTRLGKIQAS